jgi:hypothetical protein
VSGHRHAAVALQALELDDRRAILDELPAPDRAILAAYLEELDTLGFDCAAVNDSLAAPRAAELTARQRIELADANEMLALLAGEPVQYGAALLAMGPWPWAAQLAALWEPHNRHALTAPYAGAAAPALRECMLNEVARRLGAPVARAQAPRSGAVSRLKQRMAAWIR